MENEMKDINLEEIHFKKPNQRKKILIVIVFVVIGLVGVGWYYGYFQFLFSTADLCSEFPKIEGEISCEYAIKLALKKYPGEIYSVDSIKVTRPTNGYQTQKEIWIIEIDLKEPIRKYSPERGEWLMNNIKIFIDKQTGELRTQEI